MTETINAEIQAQVRQRVRTLFRAENGPNENIDENYIAPPHNTAEGIRSIVDGILANDYLPIVRGKGQVDRDREDTLKKISAGSPGFVRHVELADIRIDLFLDNRLAIVRSLLPCTDSRNGPPVDVSYRNMQVFLHSDAVWQCIAWQVTRIE